MPITLHQERDLQSIAMAKKSAALCQDAVIALGKALHEQSIDEADRAALETSASLIEAVASEETGLRPALNNAQLFTTNSGLTALWAARAEGHEQDAGDFFRGLGEALRRYLGGDATLQKVAPDLTVLRGVFLRMGEFNLSVVNAATQVHDVGPPWTSTPRRSPS